MGSRATVAARRAAPFQPTLANPAAAVLRQRRERNDEPERSDSDSQSIHFDKGLPGLRDYRSQTLSTAKKRAPCVGLPTARPK
jgi:hypothetical protein